MAVPRPSVSRLRVLADELGFHLTDGEFAAFATFIDEAMVSYDIVDGLADNLPPVAYPRTPGYRPDRAENPHNAWYMKSRVAGKKRGRLAGKTIALKDTICLAGVPMMNGAAALEGYVPETDATIVTRMLDAGGTILGKANTEAFSLSASSHTSALGPVDNPHKPGWSAGGSSSGCGALVAAGEVDMAIGCDQAGSLRIPASACGLYGMKQTYGLVPYTGILSQEYNVDHAGPMTRTVADNALLLEVLAGDDGIDPRQRGVRKRGYRKALGGSAKGLRIGVLEEGFGFDDSDPGVDAKVREAAARFAKLGADVRPVSVPMHRVGAYIWRVFAGEGYYHNIWMRNGFGTDHGGLYVTSVIDALANWQDSAGDSFPPHVKIRLLMGHFVSQAFHGRYYAKALNISRRLRNAYDAALAEVDLLLLPTFTVRPNKLPPADIAPEEFARIAFAGVVNTPPFNLTHHPALSLPCGKVDGLPIGAMLVGRHFDEPTIYRAAHAFEQAGDWQRM